MGLNLNDVTDEILLENLPHDLRRLSRSESKLPVIESAAVEKRLHFWSTYGNQLLDVALSYYQLERPPKQIVEMLQRAASALGSYLQIPDAMRERAWKIVEYFSWSLAFGERTTKKHLEQLAPYQIRDETAKHELYLQTLIAFVRGENIRDSLEKLINLCSDRKAGRHISLVTLPCAKALRAVVTHDSAGLNAALSDLLKHHQREVRGEFKTDRLHGFMIVPALPYLRLALERNIPLTIDSVYLPIWLVELACKTTSST